MLKHPRPILRRRKRSSFAPKTRQLIDAKSARDARRRVGRTGGGDGRMNRCNERGFLSTEIVTKSGRCRLAKSYGASVSAGGNHARTRGS